MKRREFIKDSVFSGSALLIGKKAAADPAGAAMALPEIVVPAPPQRRLPAGETTKVHLNIS